MRLLPGSGLPSIAAAKNANHPRGNRRGDERAGNLRIELFSIFFQVGQLLSRRFQQGSDRPVIGGKILLLLVGSLF